MNYQLVYEDGRKGPTFATIGQAIDSCSMGLTLHEDTFTDVVHISTGRAHEVRASEIGGLIIKPVQRRYNLFKKRRVRVWDGKGENELGYGWLVGYVNVHVIESPDGGSILSDKLNPEEELPPMFQELLDAGYRKYILSDNPKIELDSGATVYGCQVWWRHEED